jgi:hypothetical protein
MDRRGAPIDKRNAVVVFINDQFIGNHEVLDISNVGIVKNALYEQLPLVGGSYLLPRIRESLL